MGSPPSPAQLGGGLWVRRFPFLGVSFLTGPGVSQNCIRNSRMGNSLAVQWLGLGTLTTKGPGLI